MGFQIEDPLSILPLSTVCCRLEESILSLHSENEEIKMIASKRSSIENDGFEEEGICGIEEMVAMIGSSNVAPLRFANVSRVANEAQDVSFHADSGSNDKAASNCHE